jgi:hypothetical protein
MKFRDRSPTRVVHSTILRYVERLCVKAKMVIPLISGRHLYA